MVGDSAAQTSDGWEILDLWESGKKLNDKPPLGNKRAFELQTFCFEK